MKLVLNCQNNTKDLNAAKARLPSQHPMKIEPNCSINPLMCGGNRVNNLQDSIARKPPWCLQTCQLFDQKRRATMDVITSCVYELCLIIANHSTRQIRVHGLRAPLRARSLPRRRLYVFGWPNVGPNKRSKSGGREERMATSKDRAHTHPNSDRIRFFSFGTRRGTRLMTLIDAPDLP